MDRYLILRHLAQARQHQAIGEAHLARQHEIIVELERDGHDSKEAKKLFAQFLIMQAMHIEHCSQLERELAEIESEPATNSSNGSRTPLISGASPFLKSWQSSPPPPLRHSLPSGH
jgi:hypothetical protein